MVFMQFLGKFPEHLRGTGELFRATNEVCIASIDCPEIREHNDIVTLFCPGKNTDYSNNEVMCLCRSEGYAVDLYNRLLSAILEWSGQ
jgi:hypothetical protein